MNAFPVFLDLAKLCIVIVGGGKVAARKADAFVRANAKRVRVVSPTFSPEMPGEVERVVSRYDPDHLHGANLVIAATNDESVNRQVMSDAHDRALLVNLVDRGSSGLSDFATGVVITSGPVTIGVHSGGVPGLSRLLADLIQEQADPTWPTFAMAVAHARKKSTGHDRARLMSELTTRQAFDHFKRHGTLPEVES